MRTRVKFCGMVRPADIDAAVAIGADAIGFVFYPGSPRFVETAEAASLRHRLPSWVMAVGLFVDAPAAGRDAIVREVGLDVVQAHGNETAQALADCPVPYWKALRIGGKLPLGEQAALPQWLARGRVPADPAAVQAALACFAAADCCLVDSASAGFGGSGLAFDWSVLPQQHDARLVLAGGLDADTVGQAIAVHPVFAVDVSSGIQGNGPREKDVSKMERFMAAVQRADLARQMAGKAACDRKR